MGHSSANQLWKYTVSYCASGKNGAECEPEPPSETVDTAAEVINPVTVYK